MEKQWVQLLGSSGEDSISDITSNRGGDIYVSGVTDGPLGSQGEHEGESGFLAKFIASGELAWVRVVGTPEEDEGTCVAVDEDGSVFLGGYTKGSFGNGSSDPSMRRGFVARYDASGKRDWIELIGEQSSSRVEDIAVREKGGLFITGRGGGSLGGEQDSELTGAFVARYHQTGDRKWIRLLGGSEVWPRSIALASGGAVYVGGRTWGSYLGGRRFTGPNYEGFVARYDSSGERQWVRPVGAHGDSEVLGIATDANGLLYAGGIAMNGIGDREPGDSDPDGFMAKYDKSGSRKWVRLFATGGEGPAGIDGVDVGVWGGIYGAGTVTGPIEGDETTDVTQDVFLISVSPSGDDRWIHRIRGPSPQSATALSALRNRELLIAGTTFRSLDGKQHNGGGKDGFVARFR